MAERAAAKSGASRASSWPSSAKILPERAAAGGAGAIRANSGAPSTIPSKEQVAAAVQRIEDEATGVVEQRVESFEAKEVGVGAGSERRQRRFVAARGVEAVEPVTAEEGRFHA